MDARYREPVDEYIIDTLKDIDTVRNFCFTEQNWTLNRVAELNKMENIKSLANQSHRKQLELELAAVLNSTLRGLETLQRFLDAVERLAVTSLLVFMDERFLPRGVAAAAVQSVIIAARVACPLLILFKRDAAAFFTPNLDNVDVLELQLKKYISITQTLCGTMKNPSLEVSWSMTGAKQNRTNHFNQLREIRRDESFRLRFIFHTKAQQFIDTYGGCRFEMLEFLSDLDKIATQLDKMKKGSRISKVVGSSVGATAGALSIVGLVLAPVTAGVSLGLTTAGVGLGVASGVTGIATSVAGMVIEKKKGKNANYIFESFMEDVDKVTECLEDIANSNDPVRVYEGNVVVRVMGTIARTVSVANGINNLVKGGKALGGAGGVGVVAIKVLFIGVDLRTVIKESKNLAKGKYSKVAHLIVSRSALWRSEIVAWDKIYFSLQEGQRTHHRKLEILERFCY